MSGPLVVDASVAIKWVLEEPDSELAERALEFEVQAPDWLVVECGNAIWRHVQLGEFGSRRGHAHLERIREMPLELVSCVGLVDRAFGLSADLHHPIYDCLYLALALDRGARIVTADRRFVRTVRASRDLADHVVLLSELGH